MLSRPRIATFSVATLALVGIPFIASADVTPDDTITALAGTHVRGFGGDGGPATDALVNEPRDTAVGPDGSIYIADTFNDRIRRIAPDGTISTFAGNGSHTVATDPDVGDGGPATQADINWPHDVMVDGQGNVFIADANHNRLREVTTDGIIHTIAGNGKTGATGNGGLATKATLKNPKTVFRSGNTVYTAGLDNEVRAVNLDTGIITLVAGSPTAGYADGLGSAARFNSPQRVQVDDVGNIYVADTDNSAIRRVTPGGLVTTVLGQGVGVTLATPRGIALEGNDTLYVADSNAQKIRKLNLLTGANSVVAGSSRGFSGNGGPAKNAKFYQPRGLTVTPDGDLIVADTFNDQIRLITHNSGGTTPPPPPPPATERLSNNSVETSGSPYLGKFSSNDTITWTTEAAQDGTHSIKMANNTTTASDTGLLATTTVTSTAGDTYTASAWVKGAAGQRVAARLQECPSSGCLTVAANKVTLPDTDWHQVSTTYVSKQGAPLKYSVVAYAQAAGTADYADQFSVTEQTP